MSKQYDYQSGYDPSGKSEISALELLQLVNQIKPLSNIGGVISQSTAPDITNNPRFSRYVWLDTSVAGLPSAKIYDATEPLMEDRWKVVNVAENAVVEASISNHSVTLPKLAGDSNGAHAYYILRQNAAGTEIEVVDLLTAIGAASGIGSGILNMLAGKTSGGGATISGNTSQKVFSWNGTDLALVDPSFALSMLGVGTAEANKVPANIGGAWTPTLVKDLIADGTLAVKSLVKGSVDGKILATDSGAVNWVDGITKYAVVDGTGLVSNTTGIITIPHGWTTQPKIIQASLVISSALTAGYSVGEEVPWTDLYVQSAAGWNPWLSYYADAVNIYVRRNSTPVKLFVPNKAAGAWAELELTGGSSIAGNDIANFIPRFRIFA